jgi:hypothetical protein
MDKSKRSMLLGGGLVFAAAAAVYTLLIRPWQLRWGADEKEVDLTLPGDELVPTPRLNATHAITIQASRSVVWSWLVQIGQGRGGFYSYDWIENMMGLDIHTANRILPDHQQLEIGDLIPLAADGFAIPVAIVEPGKVLVLHGDTRLGPQETIPKLKPGDYLSVNWGFYLFEQEDGSTRLVERWRADWNPSFQNTLFYRLFLEPGAFVMERKMLLGIKHRAENMA